MTLSVPPTFRAGDRVRVRQGDPSGHVRTPSYIRGRRGEIAIFVAAFPNPEDLAYGGDGEPTVPLYRVRFRQIDVWPRYRGDPRDTLDIEIYQHWLEPDENHHDP